MQWTPELHKFFPAPFRELVRTLLMCRASSSTFSCVKRALPGHVLIMIIRYLVFASRWDGVLIERRGPEVDESEDGESENEDNGMS